MVKGLMGYLYLDHTVVIEKDDIKGNPPDENFRPVRIFIDEKYIRQWHEELEMMAEIEGQQEMEW